MSIQHCFNCGNEIDTDFDAEHFDICGKEPKYKIMGDYDPLKEVDKLVEQAKELKVKRINNGLR